MAAAIDLAATTGGRQAELMQRFTSFLESDNGRIDLVTRIQRKPLIVCLDDLRDFDSDLARDLMERPVEVLPIFENSMYELITGLRQDLACYKLKLSKFNIGLDGAFGSRHLSP